MPNSVMFPLHLYILPEILLAKGSTITIIFVCNFFTVIIEKFAGELYIASCPMRKKAMLGWRIALHTSSRDALVVSPS